MKKIEFTTLEVVDVKDAVRRMIAEIHKYEKLSTYDCERLASLKSALNKLENHYHIESL